VGQSSGVRGLRRRWSVVRIFAAALDWPGPGWGQQRDQSPSRQSMMKDSAPLRRVFACCGSATPLVSKWLKQRLTLRRKVAGDGSMPRGRPNGLST
jgi:hypothetical protein